MELRHLKYFVAVAEEQNVTRAGARLHVSQPPLSRQIRDLEHELGVSLFERSPKSIRLTPAGRVFLEEARAVLRRADEAVRALKTSVARSAVKLEVAYAPSLTVEILPGVLRQFQTGSPEVRVNLHDLSTDGMLDGLHRATIDVALIIEPNRKQLRGLQFEELYCYPLRVAVHPAHRFALSRKVKLEQLLAERLLAYSRTDYPEYHERLLRVFKSTGQSPQVAEEHDSSTSLIASVEAGRGVALVPASLACLAGSRLKLIPIDPPPESLKIGLARKRGPASAVVEKFVQAARTCRTSAVKRPSLTITSETAAVD